MGVFAVDFRGTVRNWWGLPISNRASFESRRDGGEGQGAGVVQVGVDEGGNVGKGDKRTRDVVFADAKVASRRHGRVLDYWEFSLRAASLTIKLFARMGTRWPRCDRMWAIRPTDSCPSLKPASGFSLPQLPVLRFRLLQDRNVSVRVLP
jgi:hypothetical protein